MKEGDNGITVVEVINRRKRRKYRDVQRFLALDPCQTMISEIVFPVSCVASSKILSDMSIEDDIRVRASESQWFFLSLASRQRGSIP
jgi:hypothetical protein